METVVFLSQQKPNEKIEVDLDLDELNATIVTTEVTKYDQELVKSFLQHQSTLGNGSCHTISRRDD